MIDRQPTKPGRVKLTNEATGEVAYFIMERADEPTEVGTPINRATLFDSAAEVRSGGLVPSDAFNNMMREIVVSVPSAGWSASASNGYHTQTIAIDWMQENYSPSYDLIISSAAQSGFENGAFALIDKMVTGDGLVTFYATGIPEIDISIRIKGV